MVVHVCNFREKEEDGFLGLNSLVTHPSLLGVHKISKRPHLKTQAQWERPHLKTQGRWYLRSNI